MNFIFGLGKKEQEQQGVVEKPQVVSVASITIEPKPKRESVRFSVSFRATFENKKCGSGQKKCDVVVFLDNNEEKNKRLLEATVVESLMGSGDVKYEGMSEGFKVNAREQIKALKSIEIDWVKTMVQSEFDSEENYEVSREWEYMFPTLSKNKNVLERSENITRLISRYM